jgi:peptidoglycan/LPS O-acetylase OafA/YrhL
MSAAIPNRTRDDGEIRALTGLRGLAAPLVAIFHFKLNNAFFQLDHTPSPAARSLGRFIDHGYLGVDLFFVLSGFVMAISYGRMFENGFSWSGYALFLRRRLARVYPLYLATTLATALLFLLHATPPAFWTTLGLNLALVQAWGFAPTLNAPGWSISTEWGAYLLFPLLLDVTLASRNKTALLVGGLSLALLALIAALPTTLVFGRVGPLDAHDASSPLPLLRCLAEFSLGLLCVRATRMLALGPRSSAGLALAASGLLVVLMMLPGTDLAIVLLFAALILALERRHGVVAGILGHPLIHGLGVLSYSFYLLHFRFIWFERVLRDRLPGLLGHDAREAIALLVTFTLLLGLSALTYAIIEKPARVWLRGGSARQLGRSRPA